MIGPAPDCMKCKHFFADKFGFSCLAFPNGIPEDIVMGAKHTTPRPGQQNAVVFEGKHE